MMRGITPIAAARTPQVMGLRPFIRATVVDAQMTATYIASIMRSSAIPKLTRPPSKAAPASHFFRTTQVRHGACSIRLAFFSPPQMPPSVG